MISICADADDCRTDRREKSELPIVGDDFVDEFIEEDGVSGKESSVPLASLDGQ